MTAFQRMVKFLYSAKNTVVTFKNEERVEASMSIALAPNCQSAPIDFWVTSNGGDLFLCTESHEKAVIIANPHDLKAQLQWAVAHPPAVTSYTLFIIGAKSFLVPDNAAMKRFNADCMENFAGSRINPMDKNQSSVIKFLLSSSYEVSSPNVRNVLLSQICMLH